MQLNTTVVRAGKELERARAIYRYALDTIPKKEARELYKAFVSFEKQHGDRKGIEDAIIDKRRTQYEEKIQDDAKDYDVWVDYLRLEEAEVRLWVLLRAQVHHLRAAELTKWQVQSG